MCSMKFLAVLIVFFLTEPCLFSQDNIFTSLQSQDSNQGKVTIYQDRNATRLILKNIELNRQEKSIQGYRIQIYSGTGNNARNEARQIQSKFMSFYPGISAYMIYQEPYFKIRIGDFRNKSEGLRVKKQIQNDFPDCYFVFENNMNLPRL